MSKITIKAAALAAVTFASLSTAAIAAATPEKAPAPVSKEMPTSASPAAESSVPAPTIDTNKDGKPDAWDRDANGTPDAWDINGDGKPDQVDNDGDGKPDGDARLNDAEPKKAGE